MEMENVTSSPDMNIINLDNHILWRIVKYSKNSLNLMLTCKRFKHLIEENKVFSRNTVFHTNSQENYNIAVQSKRLYRCIEIYPRNYDLDMLKCLKKVMWNNQDSAKTAAISFCRNGPYSFYYFYKLMEPLTNLEEIYMDYDLDLVRILRYSNIEVPFLRVIEDRDDWTRTWNRIFFTLRELLVAHLPFHSLYQLISFPKLKTLSVTQIKVEEVMTLFECPILGELKIQMPTNHASSDYVPRFRLILDFIKRTSTLNKVLLDAQEHWRIEWERNCTFFVYLKHKNTVKLSAVDCELMSQFLVHFLPQSQTLIISCFVDHSYFFAKEIYEYGKNLANLTMTEWDDCFNRYTYPWISRLHIAFPDHESQAKVYKSFPNCPRLQRRY